MDVIDERHHMRKTFAAVAGVAIVAMVTLGFTFPSLAAGDEDCSSPTIIVVDQAAYDEVVHHDAVTHTETVHHDAIPATEDHWENLGWFNWTGGPREEAPALDDEGWHGPLPGTPQGAPHDYAPGNVYSTSNGQGAASWFKYDGNFVEGMPGVPAYDEEVVVTDTEAYNETVHHDAVTHEEANPNYPCDDEENPTPPVDEPEVPVEQPNPPAAVPNPSTKGNDKPVKHGHKKQPVAVPTVVDAGL